jgi:hypothetical protein
MLRTLWQFVVVLSFRQFIGQQYLAETPMKISTNFYSRTIYSFASGLHQVTKPELALLSSTP